MATLGVGVAVPVAWIFRGEATKAEAKAAAGETAGAESTTPSHEEEATVKRSADAAAVDATLPAEDIIADWFLIPKLGREELEEEPWEIE